MGGRAAKSAFYDGLAQVAKALASGRRAEIVDPLAQGERSVDEIAAVRLKQGEIIVLETRPEPEFAAGHIVGARSAPIADLRRHLRALPKDIEVVAYCRGPYCVYADDAVRELKLKRRGFRARRHMDGFPEWKRAGLPVAAGEGRLTP